MILVTGATGFLGSELISQLLLKGEKLTRDTLLFGDQLHSHI